MVLISRAVHFLKVVSMEAQLTWDLMVQGILSTELGVLKTKLKVRITQYLLTAQIFMNKELLIVSRLKKALYSIKIKPTQCLAKSKKKLQLRTEEKVILLIK